MIKVLNSKERKRIFEMLIKQFDVSDEINEILNEYVFVVSNKGKLYIANRKLFDVIDGINAKINNIGIYFCSLEKDGIRLSIEGCQIIGSYAKKNVVSVNENIVKELFLGNDIDVDFFEKNSNGKLSDFMNDYDILRFKDDFIGCVKITPKRILNFTPKIRRISFG